MPSLLYRFNEEKRAAKAHQRSICPVAGARNGIWETVDVRERKAEVKDRACGLRRAGSRIDEYSTVTLESRYMTHVIFCGLAETLYFCSYAANVRWRHPVEQDEMREQVRADERHRLALYLHDHIGQTVALAKLQLARIQRVLREPLDRAKQTWLQATVDSLIPELDAVMQSVQEEIFLLNPTGLTEVGLSAILEQECATFSQRTGIECDRCVEALNLGAQRSALVVLIVREALSNIARHSRATTAEVRLQRSGECGVLSVRDNGIGIDPIRMGAAGSFGVRGMEERARTLGADFVVEATPSEGTRIKVSFPLASR